MAECAGDIDFADDNVNHSRLFACTSNMFLIMYFTIS